MGEVYRAKDAKLNRFVAVKVLPSNVAGDPDRLSRFEREAKAVASLSHPNILAIHDFGVSDGIAYAVTELLEGQTLRDRLTTEPLPVRKAIEIAAQIAGGLIAAHDKGIVHRDLKPENLFLTRDGQVKILDFGLVKQAATGDAAVDETHLATRAGMVLGTVAYMAPEQVRGEPLDARADLFACGAVLYEMLSGARAFDRETLAETMTAILKEDPPELTTRVDLPLPLERIVRHALEKDPKDRFQTARDLAFDLRSIGRTLESGATAHRLEAKPRVAYRRELTAWAMLAVLVIAASAVFWNRPELERRPRIANLTLDEEADMASSRPQGFGLLVTPDGSQIVLQSPSGDRRLTVRKLDEPASKSLPNTELGQILFISTDGRSLGFSNLTTLKKVSLVDGIVTSVCRTATLITSAAASADGQIVFSMGLGLWIVPEDGGTPRTLTRLAPGELSQSVAGFLPDGKTLLFTNWVSDGPRIEALAIATGARSVIVEQASGGQYVSTGHLLFVRDGVLLAAAFDVERLSAGPPVRVLDRVRTNMMGVPKLGVSRDGEILAYAEPARQSLVWVTRSGREAPLELPTRQYQYVRISRDGRRVAFADEASVWVADLATGSTTRVSSERIIFGSMDWTHDDSQLSYTVLHELVTRSVDGTGKPRTFGAQLPVWKMAPSWSPDGKTVAYSAYFGATNGDIYVEPADGSSPPRPFVETPAYDAGPQFSPDGRFVAYSSAETGRLEIYVTPFPGPGPKWPVSTGGGTHARWSRDGRELFYRNADDVMSVPIATAPRFSAGKPALLFRGRYSYASGVGLPTYDVAEDGRFLMIKSEDETVERPRIIINWAELLKQRMSAH